MVTLVVHHEVRDYDIWKPVFDEHETVRRAHGEIEHRIYQNLAEPNRVVVHNDFPTKEAAEGFMNDPTLKDVMQKAGVVGEPGTVLISLSERKVYT